MKTTISAAAAISFSVVAVAVSSPALAKGKLSDADYVAAARCQGLAVAASLKDGKLDGLVRREGRGRSAEAATKAGEAFEQAHKEGGKDRAAAHAELSGPCMAFRTPATPSIAK